jgi:hypothetical protein
MLYTFILWAAIGFTLIVIFALRVSEPWPSWKKTQDGHGDQIILRPASLHYRSWRAVQATFRKRILPEAFVVFFGNVTRLQLLVLAILLGYLMIFS